MRALVTGATGFVGGRLAAALAERGAAVRCLVRDRERAKQLAEACHELHEGDVLDADSLRGAGEGVSTVYYLVHSMGRGGDREGFAERERRAARPLIESLASETVVTDAEPARLFDVRAMGCREALEVARGEEEDLEEGRMELRH